MMPARSICAWLEELQDEFIVLPRPLSFPVLNTIKNLWDHLYWVFRAMYSQPHNLAQLATQLELTWLNISVNTFRILTDSFLAHFAAVCSAKGDYSGFSQVIEFMWLYYVTWKLINPFIKNTSSKFHISLFVSSWIMHERRKPKKKRMMSFSF